MWRASGRERFSAIRKSEVVEMSTSWQQFAFNASALASETREMSLLGNTALALEPSMVAGAVE